MKRPQLLFDIMSTVVYDPIFAEIPGFFGLTLAEFFAAATPKAWIDFELGTVDEKDTMASFFRDKRPFDAEKFRSTIRDAYRFIDDGMEPLLQAGLCHSRTIELPAVVSDDRGNARAGALPGVELRLLRARSSQTGSGDLSRRQ